MKKYLIIIVIAILALLSGIFYYFNTEEYFFHETSAYKAIPVSAPAFLQINNLGEIPTNYSVLNGLLEIEAVKSFSNWITKSDSIIKNSQNIQNVLRHEPFIVVLGIVGENNLFPLIIREAESSNRRKALENFALEMYPVPQYSIEEIDYSGFKITSLKSMTNDTSFYFCFTNGLFLASTKILLVQQSIRQLSVHNITENPEFSKVNKTVSSDSEISWYINHRTFPDLLSNLVNQKSMYSTNEFGENNRLNYYRSLQTFKNFASWSELDIKINKNEILFNGVSAANDSTIYFLSLFKNQEPVRFNTDKILPQNTSFFCSFAFSNKSLFFEKLETNFTHSDFYYKREDKIKQIETAFRVDFKNTFQNLVKNEIIVAVTNISAETEEKNTLFILQTEGKTDAENQLNLMLSSYAQRSNFDISELKSIYSIDKETRFTIYKFPFPSFPGIWLGKPFEIAEAKFAAFYDNSLIFCNSEKAMQEYLYNMVLDETLSNDTQYQRVKQNTENKGNINVYLNLSRAKNLSKEVFNDEISKTLKKNETIFENLETVNWQIINEKELFFNSIYIALKRNEEQVEMVEKSNTIWKSNIGNTITNKPAFVIHPADKNNLEIVVCDSKNNLQLITKEGRVRWKIALEEPVFSEIHQIENGANRQIQFLFNTKTKLYLIDGNGNNVAPFPITFRSPASNAVNVFDYDNNRKYRYFVAGEDKKIYVYDNMGKIVEGWNFDKTDFPVTTPIQHFRVGGKDYIAFKDKSRIYIQDRKGQTRVNTEARFENSQNLLILDTNGTPKIIASDKNGNVYNLFFSGKFNTIKTGNFSEGYFFTSDDLNGDGSPEFIFTDGKELNVLNEKGEKLFSEKFKNSIQYAPEIFTFNTKLKKIGVVDEAANRIYLYDIMGKQHQGFPLKGNSNFAIGKLSKNTAQLNLIVGDKGGNLYNYALN